jgi:hypothetical protein
MEFWFNFNCPDGKVNDLASILLGNREKAIKQLLSVKSCKLEEKVDEVSFSWKSMIIMNILGLPLMAMCFGCAIPMGIFMPSILIGSSMGTAVGHVVCTMYPNSQIGEESGMMALMGAVALLGGIQRSSISLCVIILEGTGQIQYLLPIIWTTVVSRFVGNYFNEGLYEVAQHVKHFPFLEHGISRDHLAGRSVSEIMSAPVRTLSLSASLNEIKDTIEACPHNGFPVVNAIGQLEGIVLRCQLSAIIGYEYKRDIERLSVGENPLGHHPRLGNNSHKRGASAHGKDDDDSEGSEEDEYDSFNIDSVHLTRSRATLSFIDSMTVPGTRPSYIEAMDDRKTPPTSSEKQPWDPVASAVAATKAAQASEGRRAAKSAKSTKSKSPSAEESKTKAHRNGGGAEETGFQKEYEESRLSALIAQKEKEDEGRSAQEKDDESAADEQADLAEPLLGTREGGHSSLLDDLEGGNSSLLGQGRSINNSSLHSMIEKAPRLLDGVIKRNLGGFATISNVSDVRFGMDKVGTCMYTD